MAVRAYIDTSLLVKRYLPEAGAQELEEYLMAEQPDLVVSELVRLELLSTIARKHREGQFRSEFVPHIQQAADHDFLHGLFDVHRPGSDVVRHALRLMQTLAQPVATVDSLHLATAGMAGVALFMTQDRQLARAAGETGLQVWPPMAGPTSKRTSHA